MKRVLICLTSFTTGNGIAKTIMNYYDALIKENYIVDFLLILNLASDPKYLEKIKLGHSKIFVVPDGTKIKKSIATVKLLTKTLTQNKYDIIHVNLVQLYAYSCIHTAKKLHVPNIIYHIHNPIFKLPLLKSALVKLINALCKRQSNHYFACSESAGKSVFKNKKFKVIKNLINVKQYEFNEDARNKYREQFGIKQDEIVIGVVARMEKQKNPYFVIDIIKELSKKKKIKLLWLGTGSLKDKMQKYIKEKDLSSECILLEPRNDVNEIYSAMDIFLLPSLYEGLGIVLIEAQASGLPVITSTKVPDDVEITDLVTKLNLQENIEIWVNQLYDIIEKGENKNREKYQDLIESSEYNINNNESLVRLYDNIIEMRSK